MHIDDSPHSSECADRAVDAAPTRVPWSALSARKRAIKANPVGDGKCVDFTDQTRSR
jgi:hypothetical protein